MLWKTHIAFGLLSGLVLLPFIQVSNVYMFMIIVAVASILPDIDHSRSKISSKIPIIPKAISLFFKHRGIIHSLPFMAVVVYLVNVLFGKEVALATLIGYFSHLVADGLTKAGIDFMHPFGQLKLQGFVQTGSVTEKFFFFILVLLIILVLI
jgi:inner membrane protein